MNKAGLKKSIPAPVQRMLAIQIQREKGKNHYYAFLA